MRSGNEAGPVCTLCGCQPYYHQLRRNGPIPRQEKKNSLIPRPLYLGMRLILFNLILRLLYKVHGNGCMEMCTWEWVHGNEARSFIFPHRPSEKHSVLSALSKQGNPNDHRNTGTSSFSFQNSVTCLFVFLILYRFVGEMFLIENRSFIQF